MRNTGWVQTYKGIRFFPMEPLSEEIHIEDIAHSLSMLCRFNGHCRSFYSVAEHSCHVADLCSDAAFLEGLLHDGSEAYLTDIPKPLKPFMPEYRIMEHKLQTQIYWKFDIEDLHEEEVKVHDLAMLFVEANELFPRGSTDAWDGKPDSLPDVKLQCWSPSRAKQEFLDRFYQYERNPK